MTRTYVYKLLKGAWGIRISLTAEVVPLTGPVQGAVNVAPQIWLSYGLDDAELPEGHLERLAEGLRMLASEIAESISPQPIVIVVRDLQYVESDFQVEGLTAAMSGWATEEFGLPHREIPATFDREGNRYRFEWPDQGGS